MDLHIGHVAVFDKDTSQSPPFSVVMVDPQDQQSIDAMFTEQYSLPLWMPPKVRALLYTVEAFNGDEDSIQVPEDVIGLVTIRSTWARLGLISPMTTVDPGFKGHLTMELYNLSNHKIYLRPRDRVWALIRVQLMPGTEPMYEGRYQGGMGLQMPKALPREE